MLLMSVLTFFRQPRKNTILDLKRYGKNLLLITLLFLKFKASSNFVVPASQIWIFDSFNNFLSQEIENVLFCFTSSQKQTSDKYTSFCLPEERKNKGHIFLHFTNFIYTKNYWMYLEWQLLVRALQFFWKHNMTLAGGFTSQFLHQPVMTTFQQNISSRHKFKAGRLSLALSLFFFKTILIRLKINIFMTLYSSAQSELSYASFPVISLIASLQEYSPGFFKDIQSSSLDAGCLLFASLSRLIRKATYCFSDIEVQALCKPTDDW